VVRARAGWHGASNMAHMHAAQTYRSLPQLSWDLGCLRRGRLVAARRNGEATPASSWNFPTRLLRYWFARQFVCAESRLHQRPLAVCEVGIKKGQMLRFMQAARADQAPGPDPAICSSWTGVDLQLRPRPLTGLGYARLIEADIVQSNDWQTAEFDAIILRHLLKHLHEPERVLAAMTRKMKPGSVLIGGFPPCRIVCRLARAENSRHPNANSHVSVFSPARVRARARAAGLRLDFLSGAFFLWAAGSRLEDFAWWTRFNLLFGGLFPSWLGELYWVMRKPAADEIEPASEP